MDNQDQEPEILFMIDEVYNVRYLTEMHYPQAIELYAKAYFSDTMIFQQVREYCNQTWEDEIEFFTVSLKEAMENK